MRMRVPSLALLSGLRIGCCLELWHRAQKRLGSCVAVAVAVAGSYSSDSAPSLGTPMFHGCGPKKKKEKKKKKKKRGKKKEKGRTEISEKN